MSNHIIIVGYNPILITITRLLENLNVPVVFLTEESIKTDTNSEFIVVQNTGLMLDTIKEMNLEKSRGIIIDSTEDEGLVITLISLREEYKNLIITVLTDDEDVSKLFCSAEKVDFIYKPFLMVIRLRMSCLDSKYKENIEYDLKTILKCKKSQFQQQ